jgi:magnesium chelatase family protein
VLFLDEMPEFPRHVLEVLRQPLESGEVILSRANASLKYPAKIMLVAAMNPCPCGHFGSIRKRCRCTSVEVSRYRARLSGPLLDRIDLHVDVPPVDVIKLSDESPGESSRSVRERVLDARLRQRQRLGEMFTNASMTKQMLQKTTCPSADAKRLLNAAVDKMNLSARAYDRVLRVARTIADLDAKSDISAAHISEAVRYRGEESLLLAA